MALAGITVAVGGRGVMRYPAITVRKLVDLMMRGAQHVHQLCERTNSEYTCRNFTPKTLKFKATAINSRSHAYIRRIQRTRIG